ncbi:short neuropeptide F-like [Belonocnema kinseyi]|uniref:short neuropeptide F-like n=1 Tax=Belonocnema kinseyi TaxID=2817044 RepID=UPI00143DC749|nr:short neuropeptide F-like [Belonocnema kinseyi]
MTFKRCMGYLVFSIAVIAMAAATETYPDYADEAVEKAPENFLPELYRLWMQRKALENAGYGIPIEHLMIRKSQRSPSLRLRFGRSGPAIPTGVLPRPNGGAFQDI